MQTLVPLIFALWAAYNFGPEIGYRYWGVHDPFGAAFYGGGSVFMGAMVVGIVIVWPAVRTVGNMLFGSISRGQLAAKRKLRQEPPIPAADLETTVRRGHLFTYHGLVNRDFSIQDQGRWSRERIRNDFTVRRNTAAIPRREQEAVIIFETLAAEDRLGKAADDLRFALAWGDGRCEVYHGAFRPSGALRQQHGFRSFKEVIAAEAGTRGVATEGAISVLYTMLNDAAAAKSPRAVKLMERYRAAAESNTGFDPWS